MKMAVWRAAGCHRQARPFAAIGPQTPETSCGGLICQHRY